MAPARVGWRHSWPAKLPPDNVTAERRHTSDKPPVIEMHGVTIRYGRRVLLRNFNWRVLTGERWLISGANGSGKSTLLSLVTGDNPTAYRHDVRVFGQPRASGTPIWQIRRRIGELSPEQQCYADGAQSVLSMVLSGRFNADGSLLRPTTPARHCARAWLTKFGLQAAECAPFGSLSAGEQRLVLLARTLLPQPDLLLLDEPCLNLDQHARHLVLRTLEHLLHHDHHLTVVCVAHRPDHAPHSLTHHLSLTP